MQDRPMVIAVDDSKPFLMYLSLLLNRMNLEVLPVTNAEEAIEIARVTKPHLMTMDMVMPGMDGLEAVRTIREDEELADLSVIMISSYQNKNKQWEALSLGCVDVLDKPVELRKLHKAVQNCNLHSGGRRRYLRASFEKTVHLTHQDRTYELPSVTLSERGIFLRMKDALPKKATIDIEIPVSSDNTLKVGGTVIYSKKENGGDTVIQPGIAIKFDRMTNNDCEQLTAFVEELLIGDIVASQTEPVIKPS